MALNLVVDRVVRNKIYPSLARFQAEPYTPEWREFNQHWPNTIPLRLQEYCEGHGVELNLYTIDNFPSGCYYPIGLGFFDFGTDYFNLLPSAVFAAVLHRNLKILFYYHEGDNPARIKQRLDGLASTHKLAPDCYVFVSSNSAADQLPNFVAFQDSELWYWHRNQIPADEVYTGTRSREFTALVRLHKWWRAAAMSDLHRLGIFNNSYWSYCEAQTDHDSIEDCPIEIDSIDGLRSAIGRFLDHAPYYADDLSQAQRNDHSITVEHFFKDSYCNIVIETMFDCDQSNGVLLSEKTFKPIKHGQMFFVAGAAGSLQTLRDMGYRTFDSVLDNGYDLEPNNTQRWIKLQQSIQSAQTTGLDRLFERCLPDIVHNQNLFAATKQQRLNTLIEKIYDKSR